MQFSKKDTALVKGIAILMMLFHHCFESTGRYAGYEMNFFPLTESQTVTIASFFKICVALFVFLSGYGIAKSLERTPQDGYIKQIRRRCFSDVGILVYLCFVHNICRFNNAVNAECLQRPAYNKQSNICFV